MSDEVVSAGSNVLVPWRLGGSVRPLGRSRTGDLDLLLEKLGLLGFSSSAGLGLCLLLLVLPRCGGVPGSGLLG